MKDEREDAPAARFAQCEIIVERAPSPAARERAPEAARCTIRGATATSARPGALVGGASVRHFAAGTVQPAIGSTKSTTGFQLGEMVFSNWALR